MQKLVHYFEDVKTVIFIASLCDYDRFPDNDPETVSYASVPDHLHTTKRPTKGLKFRSLTCTKGNLFTAYF